MTAADPITVSSPAQAPPPRRVLMLVTSLAQGGSERNLIQFARRMDRRRFIPEVWYLHSDLDRLRPELEAAGVRVCGLEAPRRKSLTFAWRTARRIARAPADVLHLFLPSVAYYAIVARFLFGQRTPMVFSAGTTHTELPLQSALYRRGIGRLCYPVICNSPAVMEFMRIQGVAEDRLRLIPNGHEVTRYERPLDRAALRQSLGLTDADVVVISVGRLIESKRHADLLQATALLRQRGGRLRLLIVGEGPCRADLERQAAALSIGPHVAFLGHRDDVPELLRISQLFAFPSESEGLPNALIEAALAGCPIVASDIPAVRWVVAPESAAAPAASLVAPRDPGGLAAAIARRLDDPAAASDAARLRRDAAQRFGIDRALTLLYDAYDAAWARAARALARASAP